MRNETLRNPVSGYGILALVLLLAGGSVTAAILLETPLFFLTFIVVVFLIKGFLILSPNHSAVMTLFGDYKGTVKENGFFWVNPFYLVRKISLRARNQDRDPIKVNDKMGNPVMIGAVLVWQVEETFKAAFEVDDFEHFVSVQSESAIRQLASQYPYDKFDDAEAEISLRDGGEEVNHRLEEALQGTETPVVELCPVARGEAQSARLVLGPRLPAGSRPRLPRGRGNGRPRQGRTRSSGDRHPAGQSLVDDRHQRIRAERAGAPDHPDLELRSGRHADSFRLCGGLE